MLPNRAQPTISQPNLHMTPSKAQRSCVDEQSLHGVAHRKIRQDEKKREGFSLSSAPSKYANRLSFLNMNCIDSPDSLSLI